MWASKNSSPSDGDDVAKLSARELADGLVRMVAYRDRDTAIHLDAVSALSRKLAKHMGFEVALVERVELAARLHDVGKQSISLPILQKIGPLLPEEWQELHRHPEYGAAIVACFEPLQHIAEIVRLHHERIDGNGYPERRISTEIPIESRLIAVADAFHAMTVRRVYKDAITPRQALEELLRCAGTQFDVDCTHSFVSMLEGKSPTYLSFDLGYDDRRFEADQRA